MNLQSSSWNDDSGLTKEANSPVNNKPTTLKVKVNNKATISNIPKGQQYKLSDDEVITMALDGDKKKDKKQFKLFNKSIWIWLTLIIIILLAISLYKNFGSKSVNDLLQGERLNTGTLIAEDLTRSNLDLTTPSSYSATVDYLKSKGVTGVSASDIKNIFEDLFKVSSDSFSLFGEALAEKNNAPSSTNWVNKIEYLKPELTDMGITFGYQYNGGLGWSSGKVTDNILFEDIANTINKALNENK